MENHKIEIIVKDNGEVKQTFEGSAALLCVREESRVANLIIGNFSAAVAANMIGGMNELKDELMKTYGDNLKELIALMMLEKLIKNAPERKEEPEGSTSEGDGVLN